MKNIKEFERELMSGKNVERVLPAALLQIAATNHIYSQMQFTIHYYNLYDSIADEGMKLTNAMNTCFEQINEIIGQTILESFDGVKREHAIVSLDRIRKTIICHMDSLTSLKDIFSLYEYILNRLEAEYEEVLSPPDDDEAAKNILHYIFEKSDNVTINQRIKAVLSQLPVRMTKAKVLELLKNSLAAYEGAERDTLDKYLYLLKSVTGLRRPEGINDAFPELYQMLEVFEACQFDTLDNMQFHKLLDCLKQVSEELEEETEGFYQLEEIVNSLYVVLLSLPYADAATEKEVEQLHEIVQNVYSGIKNNTFIPITKEKAALFYVVEGKLESIAQQIEQQQIILELIEKDYRDDIDAFMLDKLYECLSLAQELLSNSLFIEFDRIQNTELVNKEELEKVTSKLQNDFLTQLEKKPKEMRRAMISAALSEMPVFFVDQKDVMDYVRVALSGCHNVSEKIASVHLIYKIMQD